ncbi:MAG: LytTR family DNA-binding domain-containing protein [Bacteroidia bacterium]|nr:LytTR family DNA-binding domain-containing protein [Bacteroidia bacterium]
MTELTCIAVDDEPLALAVLEDYCHKLPYLRLVAAVRSGVDAIAFLAQQPVDFVLLDINMPELTGLQLARHLQGRTRVVFTTAYPEYALTGYELDVADYLVKPVPFDRFVQAVEKVRRLAQTPTHLPAAASAPPAPAPPIPEVLRIKSGNQYHHVPAHDILYAEGSGNYVTFHLSGGRKILALMTMTAAEELLPAADFLRIHKSYIIGLRHIRLVDTNDVHIGSTPIPIGKSYRQSVKAPLGLS